MLELTRMKDRERSNEWTNIRETHEIRYIFHLKSLVFLVVLVVMALLHFFVSHDVFHYNNEKLFKYPQIFVFS